MKEYFYEMIEKAKIDFQVNFQEEDIISLENRLFNSNLSDEQIKQKIDIAYLNVKENYEKRKTDELIKQGIAEGNTKQVREVAKAIFSDPYLADKVSIYGGSIPYLLTGKDSMRIIGDIDTHVDFDKMQEIRDYIYSQSDTITVLYDSLELSGEDFGMELVINGLNVSIFPTVAKADGMAIRNFYINDVLGEIEVKETLFPGIIEREEIRTYDVDGVQMRMMSPEFTYITKQVANRPKDIEDNEILETIVNFADVERMRQQMKKPFATEDKIVPMHDQAEQEIEQNSPEEQNTVIVYEEIDPYEQEHQQTDTYNTFVEESPEQIAQTQALGNNPNSFEGEENSASPISNGGRAR